MVTMVWIVGRN